MSHENLASFPSSFPNGYDKNSEPCTLSALRRTTVRVVPLVRTTVFEGST